MPNVSVIVFDLDGTLSDPSDGVVNALNFALETVGRVPLPADALTKYIGPPLKEIFSDLLGTTDEKRVAEGIERFRQYYLSVGYRQNRLYDGIPALLRGLKGKGARLYVATTKREDTANSVVRYLGIARYFERVYGCGLDTPKTEILEKILGREGAEGSSAFMVGDRESDIQAGVRVGMRTVGVKWGFGTPGELRRAETVVATPTELSQYFLELP